MSDDERRPIQIIINIPDLSALARPWRALSRNVKTFWGKITAFASRPPSWTFWVPGIILAVGISLVRTSVTLDGAQHILPSRASFQYWHANPTPEQMLARRAAEQGVLLRFPIGESEKEIKTILLPEPVDTVGAAFRLNNTIGLLLTNLDRTYKPQPKYSPLNDIADTRYLLDYGDEFLGVQSHAEAMDKIAEINQREKDKLALLGASTEGVVVSTIVGALDPLMLLLVLLSHRGIRYAFRGRS